MQTDATEHECPDSDTLRQYVAGQLDEPQLGQCEAHLVECSDCDDTIRGLRVDETANDSFDQFALSALQAEPPASPTRDVDAPLVDQLIRDLVQNTPNADQTVRVLENRAAEVTRLLPASSLAGSIGCLGDYEIQRLLGAGSTGIVFEAEDAKLQRKVALKVLRPSLGDAARDRFMNEARAAAAISHPNVITIYQVGVEGPLAFIAMELSAGQTLESRLDEVAFVPEEQVKQIALQVAEGLKAAHGHGLIHRDIKPANIWLKSDNDQAVILDFGLARIADDDPQMTATGMLAGTPNFMSPEQTRGLELDGRSDLFSLGCLMYRAATGKLPFGSTGILATLQAIQHDQPRPPVLLNPHLTEDFSDLVMTLLEKQPADRPESVKDLIHGLKHARGSWPFAAASYVSQPANPSVKLVEREPASTATLRRPKVGSRRWANPAVLALLTGVVGWFFSPQIIRIATDQGELVIDAKDNSVEVAVLQGGKLVRVIDTESDQSVDIKAGEYELRLKESENGFRLNSDRVVLTRGGKEIVSIVGPNGQPLPSKPVTKEDKQRVKLIDNMRRISIGLLNYESANQHFPAIGNRDADGKLLLSWRVHLLPFLEQDELYNRFRLDEPWNSPHNLELLPLMPAVYKDPANPNPMGLCVTRIQMPSGKGFLVDPERWKPKKDQPEVADGGDKGIAMGMNMGRGMEMGSADDLAPSNEGVGFADTTDGSSNTMALIQINEGFARPWTCPVDWNGDVNVVEPTNRKSSGRIDFFMADGSHRHLVTPFDAKFLVALLTRAGGEVINFANQTARFPLVAKKSFTPQSGGGMGMGMGMGVGMGMGMDMDMDMGAGMEMDGMDMGMDGRPNNPPPALYAGQTFDQWMHVVKNDRQLKTKFEALAATAELAQGNESRKKQVMDQIKPLLEKYGSNTMNGGDPFQKELTGGTLKNTFQKSELTDLFVEILRRFPADDLMDLAIDIIGNGNANSRDFLVWLWLPSSMRANNPEGQSDYFRAIDRHAVRIARGVLDAVKTCDPRSRVALMNTIESVHGKIGLEIKPGQDPLTQYYYYSEVKREPTGKRYAEWKQLISKAFESDQPMQQGFVAVTMAKVDPDRPGLAEDLAKLLAGENVLPELRAAGMYGLEELPLEKIESVAVTLLQVGQASGPAKDQLIAWTKKHQPLSFSQQFAGVNGSYPIGIDARIGYLLSQLEAPPKELLSWLKELRAKAEAEPGLGRFGGPDQSLENQKIVIARAMKAVDPEAEPYSPPKQTAGGVF